MHSTWHLCTKIFILKVSNVLDSIACRDISNSNDAIIGYANEPLTLFLSCDRAKLAQKSTRQIIVRRSTRQGALDKFLRGRRLARTEHSTKSRKFKENCRVLFCARLTMSKQEMDSGSTSSESKLNFAKESSCKIAADQARRNSKLSKPNDFGRLAHVSVVVEGKERNQRTHSY